jgi:hypothetical protein
MGETMSVRMVALGALMVSLPVVVEVPDSTDGGDGETRITLIGGAGRYAIIDRGCDDQVLARHPARFRETGAAIEHRFANDLTLGVRGGTIEDRKTFRYSTWDYATDSHRDTVIVAELERSYVNPFVAIETPGTGMGAGWMVGNRKFAPHGGLGDDVSFHLRIGPEDRLHFRLSHMEGLPYWTGGELLEMGFGGRPRPRCDLFVGLSGGEPFDGAGLGIKADIRVAPHWLLVTRARLAQSGGAGQNAIAVGITYASRAAVMPRAASPAESGAIGRP